MRIEEETTETEEMMTVEIDTEVGMTTVIRAMVLIKVGVHHLIEVVVVVETCHIATMAVDLLEITIIVIRDATMIEIAIMITDKEEKDLDLMTIREVVAEQEAGQDQTMAKEMEAAEDTTVAIEVLQEANTMAPKAQTLT